MDYKEELEQIRKDNGGVLRPRDVVAFAKDPDTALNGRFEWDDGLAAERFRLWQARELIRVIVIVSQTNQEVSRVSLEDDRGIEGGGYRTLDDVMTSQAMREALLRQAKADMNRFEAKYASLEELAHVVEAMQATKTERKRKPRLAVR